MIFHTNRCFFLKLLYPRLVQMTGGLYKALAPPNKTASPCSELIRKIVPQNDPPRNIELCADINSTN